MTAEAKPAVALGEPEVDPGKWDSNGFHGIVEAVCWIGLLGRVTRMGVERSDCTRVEGRSPKSPAANGRFRETGLILRVGTISARLAAFR